MKLEDILNNISQAQKAKYQGVGGKGVRERTVRD
jgi:hypothetical protein